MYNLKKLAFEMQLNDCIHCEIADCMAKSDKELQEFIMNVWKLQNNTKAIKKYFYPLCTDVEFSSFIKLELTPLSLTSVEKFFTCFSFPLCIEFTSFSKNKTLFVDIKRRSALFDRDNKDRFVICDYNSYGENGKLFSIHYDNFSFDDLK